METKQIENVIKKAKHFVAGKKSFPAIREIYCNGVVSATDLETTYVYKQSIGLDGTFEPAKAIAALNGANVKPGKLEDYPAIPKIDDAKINFGIVNPEQFFIQVKKLLPYVSRDETRYNICGVYFELGSFKMTATDGHRLRTIDTLGLFSSIHGKDSPNYDIIINRESLEKLIKVFGRTRDTIEVEIGNGYACFSQKLESVYCRMVDGKFFDYKQVIPESMWGMTLETEPLKKFVDLVCATAGKEKSPCIKLQFAKSFEGNKPEKPMLFCKYDSQGVVLRESFPIIAGYNLVTTGIQAPYLRDFLKDAESPTFTISVENENQPMRLHDGGFATIVIMPMRFE